MSQATSTPVDNRPASTMSRSPATERPSAPKPGTYYRRLHSDHVRYWMVLPDFLRRQSRPSQTHDLRGSIGLGISMMLIAILLSLNGTAHEEQTASAAVAFFFTYMLSMSSLPSNAAQYLAKSGRANFMISLWRLCELYSMPETPAPSCSSEGYSGRYFK